MKKKMFAFLMMVLTVGGLCAQDAYEKTKIYRTWISMNVEPFKIKGSLYQVNDSSIFVSNALRIQDYAENRFETVELQIENIMKIETRKKNSVGKGALVGAISGLVFGGLIGLVAGGDYLYSAPESALIAGVPFAIVGAGLGALGGSAKIVIPINGSADTLNQNKKKLREQSVAK